MSLKGEVRNIMTDSTFRDKETLYIHKQKYWKWVLRA